MNLFSAALLLVLVMDPFGNVPLFLSVVQPVAPARRRRVIARELVIALGFMLVFLFAGRHLLEVIGIDEPALSVAGGIILFMIALKMVFPDPAGAYPTDVEEGGEEPFIVPLAVPFVAGPSALAAVLYISGTDPGRWPEWLAAVVIAWSFTGIVLLFSVDLAKALGRRGLVAIERLMGMVLTAIATRMVLGGVRDFYGL